MSERSEYFKDTLDCVTTNDPNNITIDPASAPLGVASEADAEADFEDDDGGSVGPYTGCIECRDCCDPSCKSNGVAACNNFCPCFSQSILSYKRNMRHGYVKMPDGQTTLYYVSILTTGDTMFNPIEYKSNLIMPTTVTELGSSTFCDIDDAPFIMNQLPPTTFQVSYETLKYKFGNTIPNYGGYDIARNIESIKDKDGSLNLRAYVEFSCIATVCLNTPATVNGSQIGVELIDSDDIGVEIGNCFMRFEHDTDIREYFCHRFSGYKNGDLDVHYMRPGSNQFENAYNTYTDIILEEGQTTLYRWPNENPVVEGDELTIA